MGKSTTQRIAKNFFWIFSGDLLSKVLLFFVALYFARILGVVAFGLLSFAQAFLEYLLLLVDSGLSVFGMRKLAQEKAQASRIALNIFAIRFLIALILYILSLLILWFLPIDLNLKYLFAATFLILFYQALNTDWVFQGIEKMEYVGFFRILSSLIFLLLVFFFIKSSADLIRIPLFQFMSGILVAVLFLFILFKKIMPAKLEHLAPHCWRDYFLASLPLGASYILVQVYINLDAIMLGFMRTQEEVGLYSAAYKLFYASIFILGLWQATVFPTISRRLKENRDQALVFLNKYIRLTLMFVVPLAFFIVIVSPLLIKICFGPNYMGSTVALRILVWNIIPIALSGTFGTLILIPLGFEHRVLWGVGAGALLNIILNFLLIPMWGFPGAAIATLLAEITVAGVIFVLAHRKFPINIFGPLFIPGIRSFLVFVFVVGTMFFVPLSGNSRNIVMGSLFCLVYGIALIFSRERSFLLDFVKEIKK